MGERLESANFQSLTREALFREAIYKGLRFVWEVVPFLDSNGVIWRNGK